MDNAVRQAVVILTENNRNFLSGPTDTSQLVGGLTLPERIVHQLAEAGVTRIHVTGVSQAGWVSNRSPVSATVTETPTNSSFQAALAYLNPNSAILVVRADRVYDQRAIVAAARCLPAADRALAVQSHGPESVAKNTQWIGIVALGSILTERLARHNTVKERTNPSFQDAGTSAAFDEIIGEISDLRRIDTLWVQPDLWHVAEVASQFDGATDVIFRHMGRTSDGFVSRHINRRVSRAVSRRIVNSDVTANMMSGAVLVIGLVASMLTLTMESWLIALGGVLYNFASVLDGVDGELARARFQVSKLGAWWSATARHVQEIAYMLSIGYVLVLSNGDSTTGILAVTAAALYVLQGFAENISKLIGSKSRHASALFEFPDPEVGLAPLHRLGRGVAALIQRDVRALILGMLAIGGWISVIPAIGVAVSAIAVLHFVARMARDAMRLAQHPVANEA